MLIDEVKRVDETSDGIAVAHVVVPTSSTAIYITLFALVIMHDAVYPRHLVFRQARVVV